MLYTFQISIAISNYYLVYYIVLISTKQIRFKNMLIRIQNHNLKECMIFVLNILYDKQFPTAQLASKRDFYFRNITQVFDQFGIQRRKFSQNKRQIQQWQTTRIAQKKHSMIEKKNHYPKVTGPTLQKGSNPTHLA